MVGPQPRNRFVNALLRGLGERGYVHGEHFVTEVRGAEGNAERFPDLVDELLRLQVDVIVTVGAALRALRQATATIPVVVAGTDDPVGTGFVQSLARPGGNVTGLSFQRAELIGKQLELLKEVAPTAGPVAVLRDQKNSTSWEAAEAAPPGSGGGNCCHSRSEILASWRGPLGRRLARRLSLCS
jgi:ABC-type uncharacterized transport system substrate-binding protein